MQIPSSSGRFGERPPSRPERPERSVGTLLAAVRRENNEASPGDDPGKFRDFPRPGDLKVFNVLGT